MNNVRALTGYFPAFPARHLNEDQFRALGSKLLDALPDQISVFGEGYTLRDCWAHRFLLENPGLLPSDHHPAKDRFASPRDMVASNIAILQRFQWLQLAAVQHPEVDTWVWLEYTICKQPGVTGAVIRNFMNLVAYAPFDAVSLPGCWPKGFVDDSVINWRFCGSCWICPSHLVKRFAEGAKAVATLRTEMTGTISWDVNTLASLELLDVVPMRWYQGNHDASQLTNYLGDVACAK